MTLYRVTIVNSYLIRAISQGEAEDEAMRLSEDEEYPRTIVELRPDAAGVRVDVDLLAWSRRMLADDPVDTSYGLRRRGEGGERA